MNKKDLPIGVFDSGLGGLSVLKELTLVMPCEKYIYFGDSANAPYGTKSHGEILELTMKGADTLIKKGVKALVIACNTATSIAINDLRAKYSDIPIIGLEPALKPAAERSKGGKIIVMATPATLSEKKFAELLAKYKHDKDISLLPAPGVVELVEHGRFETPELYSLLSGLFEPFKLSSVESIVLGCTHYPFIKNEILTTVGAHVTLYDGGHGAAAETQKRLRLMNLLGDKTVCIEPQISVENSLGTAEIFERSQMLLNKTNKQ